MIVENQTLRNKTNIFSSREKAGNYVAKLLQKESFDYLLIIPNGGLPVGFGFLQEINTKPAEVGILIVKKIHVPWSTESGMGALTPDGDIFLNKELIDSYSIKNQEVQKQIQEAKKRIKYIQKAYGVEETINVKDKSVLILDDGIASGFSMLASVRWIRKKGAKRILIGTPTAPKRSLKKIEDKVDKIFCVNIRTVLRFAVADAYQHWYDLSLEEAVNYYKKICDIIEK
ncbi:MAG: phosphoribosyltransferase family protein [Asgard group archaeon]|nr:phosphoribosyltransferase family protein [Asgard group archaeon]